MRAAEREKKNRKKSIIIVVPLCLKDADGAHTRSDQKVNDYSGTIVSERHRWHTYTFVFFNKKNVGGVGNFKIFF